MILARLQRMNGGFADRELASRAFVLGLITLSASLAMNLYVPAFPMMAADLGVEAATIQLSVSTYLAALAIGHNIYGPWSDRAGRKRPLCAGLALYLLASIGAATAASAEALIAWRFAQGLGACAALVIPRALIRDLYTGVEAASVAAIVMLVVAIGPLLAPMAGSALVAVLPWHALFWLMAASAVATLLLVLARLPEGPIVASEDSGQATLASRYRLLLGDRRFVAQVLLLAFAQAGFFVFLAGSSYVFQQVHGLTSLQYGAVYGASAVAWVGAAQFAPGLIGRMGGERLATIALLVAAGVMLLLLAAVLAGLGGAVAILVAVTVMFGSVGISMPTVTVIALHEHGAAAGTATALIGTLSFAIGAALSALLSALPPGGDLPMVALMTACAVATCALAPAALGVRR